MSEPKIQRRLLVVGSKQARLPSIGWDAVGYHNILDYQGIILDCRETSSFVLNDILRKINQTLDTFVHSGHPVFVILPPAKLVSSEVQELWFLPLLGVQLLKVKGRTLRLSTEDALTKNYSGALDGHEVVMKPHVYEGASWRWHNAVVDNVARPVCATYGNMWFLHAPSRTRESLGIRAILDSFGPDYEEPEPEMAPNWTESVVASLPGMNGILDRIKEIETQTAKLLDARDAELKKKEQLQRWGEMLWLDGIPLQNRICEALNFLSVAASSENATGHMGDLRASHGETEFVFEVSGSIGSIGVEKARQLLQWISELPNPQSAKGVLVGNPFRNEPPTNRPPTQNHKLFVSEVEQMAQRFHFALLDVREIFRLVVAKLSGANIEPDAVYQDLRVDGNVKFRLP